MGLRHCRLGTVFLTSLACVLVGSATGETVLQATPLSAASLSAAVLRVPPTVKTVVREADPPVPSTAPAAAPRAPLLLVWATRSDDRLELDPYDREGRLLPEAHRAISHFLRCRRTGRVKRIDPALIAVMFQISRDYPGRAIEVISGYRARSVGDQEVRRSRHRRGQAVDIRVHGVRPAKLSRALWKTYDGIAVGYYPRHQFVHVDVRARPLRWVEQPDGRNRYFLRTAEELQRGLARIPAGFPRPAPVEERVAVARVGGP